MNRRLPRLSLFISAALFAAVAVWFLAAPAEAGSIVDIQLPTPSARVDFRATYGGLNIGIAVLMLIAALQSRDEYVRAGLALQIGVFAGLAVGRLIGMAAESAAPAPNPVFLVIEICGAALGILALRRLRRRD